MIADLLLGCVISLGVGFGTGFGVVSAITLFGRWMPWR